MKATPPIITAIGLISIAGAYGWALIAMMFVANGSIGPKFLPIGSDFMVYYAAARVAIAGHLPVIFDVDRFTALQNRLFADWLAQPLLFRPWLYPLQYLFLLVPFGLLSPVAAFLVFLTSTFVGFAASLGRRAGGAVRLLALLLSPASCRTVIAGQNSFLTAGLLIGGFRLLDANPTVGGVLLGVLAFKPQLAPLVPIGLIAGRRWRALASAAATTLLLVAGSAIAFGAESWRLWGELAISPARGFATAWQGTALLRGASAYAVLVGFGTGAAIAIAVQGCAMLLAAGAVFWAFRRVMSKDLQLSILLVGSLVADPHLQGYDMTLLSAAVVLVFPRHLNHPLPGEATVLAMAWLAPFLTYGTAAKAATLMAFLAVAAMLGYLCARAIVSAPSALSSAACGSERSATLPR